MTRRSPSSGWFVTVRYPRVCVDAIRRRRQYALAMKRSQGRTGYWFPLALFAVVVLAATGFYWQHFPGCPASQRVCAVPIAYVSRISSWSFLGSGLTPLFQPNSAALYWLIAIPLALVLCGVFFWRQQRRGGARVRILPAAITTATLLVIVVLFNNIPSSVSGDLTVRGLVALLFIGAGIAVLAIVERTVSLGAFAASFLALVLLANLYDISNVIGFGSSPQAAELPNVVLPGLLLLLGAIAFGLSDLRRRSRNTTAR